MTDPTAVRAELNAGAPVIARPIALGADVVMHSTTKYLGGHGDLLGGAIIARDNDAFFAGIRATSLGGPEPLIEHRASVEGPRTQAPENLLRLSLGLEHPDEVIADLMLALDGAGDR